MSRNTLKVPSRSANVAASEESRPRSKKPVRSGAKSPKQSAAQKAAARNFVAAPPRERTHVPRPPRPDAAPERPVAPPTGVERRLAEVQRSAERATQRAAAQRPAEAAIPATEVFVPRSNQRPASPNSPRNTPRPEQRSGPRQDTRPPQRTAQRPPVRPVPAPAESSAAPAALAVEEAEAGPSRGTPKEPPRLSRRMSELGLCSRREADEWIENGWVMVDGVVVKTLGARVHPKAKIEIKAAASKHQSEEVTILLNKPEDVLCEAGEEGQSAALALIRGANHWAEDESAYTFKATHLRRLALAGKLDTDSSGMVVFTQEGSVARRVNGDEARMEKEYQVKVKGELVEGGLEKLRQGLSLDDIRLKAAQVSWQTEGTLRFVLRESRPRQIHRMCELVGLTVVGIKRIRIGSVSLGKLPVGQWRYLRDNERF